MGIIVVTGPPAAGKTTYIREHKQHGDVIIDYDEIANALAGHDADNHEHESHIKAITKAARQAAIDKAIDKHD
ncbi:AAA family ATPase [Corynebacterium macginleyi]|nr:AAA family ATPase [Corynebacterium macginleyi]QRJ57471.1 AAA family ATPase [Corynebacterium macginleyi]